MISERMTDWIEVQIRSSLDAGEVLGILGDPRVGGAWQDGDTIRLYWPATEWSPDRLDRIRDICRQLGENEDVVISVTPLPQQDWNRQWAESMKPLRIGRRLVIRPSWEAVTIAPHQIEIILDPKQAFGTGHHATTRLLLEWLEDVVQGGETVLDVGTGSGILAMVALRLGAALAVGIDQDPVAIDCAREAARVNGFGSELVLRCGELQDLDPSMSFRLVLANLDQRTLVDQAEKLAHHSSDRLLVSGLLSDQGEEVAVAFGNVGLYPGRQREQDGWLTMEFLRVPH
ncbi:MAG: 50S ribosomal protein L11 methyltransferase [Nitrospira sp.]|nr:50S ribosomal protein L11 methyltransferase [Nitrospira sp.]MCP9443132.1 50S ribosomal protein L11 methyltransferase [Nitrospira sp.]